MKVVGTSKAKECKQFLFKHVDLNCSYYYSGRPRDVSSKTNQLLISFPHVPADNILMGCAPDTRLTDSIAVCTYASELNRTEMP